MKIDISFILQCSGYHEQEPISMKIKYNPILNDRIEINYNKWNIQVKMKENFNFSMIQYCIIFIYDFAMIEM